MAKRVAAEALLAFGGGLTVGAARSRARPADRSDRRAPWREPRRRSTGSSARSTALRPRTVSTGAARAMPMATLERYCELVAALKIRTANRKGRHSLDRDLRPSARPCDVVHPVRN